MWQFDSSQETKPTAIIWEERSKYKEWLITLKRRPRYLRGSYDLSDWENKGRWVGNYLKPYTLEEWSHGTRTQPSEEGVLAGWWWSGSNDTVSVSAGVTGNWIQLLLQENTAPAREGGIVGVLLWITASRKEVSSPTFFLQACSLPVAPLWFAEPSLSSMKPSREAWLWSWEAMTVQGSHPATAWATFSAYTHMRVCTLAEFLSSLVWESFLWLFAELELSLHPRAQLQVPLVVYPLPENSWCIT